MVTPLAFKVVVEPAQIDDELTAIEGALPIDTEAVFVLIQPSIDVPVTV